jgi:hypothetical protein
LVARIERNQFNLVPGKFAYKDRPDRHTLNVFEKAVLEGWDAEEDASFDLINVEPSTMAGIMALLRYAAEFEGRGGRFPQSALDEDDLGIVHKKNGAPFSYFIYKNVADALENIAAVAGKAVES